MTHQPAVLIPPRRTRILRYLKRADLWDQVYTRTLANVISVGILAITGVIFGFIKVNRHVVLTALAGVGATLVVIVVLAIELAIYRPIINRFVGQSVSRWDWLITIISVVAVLSMILIALWVGYGLVPSWFRK